MRIIDTATVEVQVSYTEPIEDSANLAYTSVYYKTGGVPVAAAKTPVKSVSGGAAISIPLIVPAPDKAKTTFDFWATATNTLGAESVPSNHATFVVDREAPAAPTSFSVA